MPKKRRCPKCDSAKIAKILYGEPDFSPTLREKLEKGEIVLGGCLISPGNPQWKCLDCKNEWSDIVFDDVI